MYTDSLQLYELIALSLTAEGPRTGRGGTLERWEPVGTSIDEVFTTQTFLESGEGKYRAGENSSACGFLHSIDVARDIEPDSDRFGSRSCRHTEL